jgi:ATP-dependent DNA helicase RecG
MNIGRADQLGSGIRNLYKYTKLYSGGEPELIEGDVFRTIIPLAISETSEKQVGNKRKTSEKQANTTIDKKECIIKYIEKREKVSVAELAGVFNLSEVRIRAILLEMTKKNLIKKIGKTKASYYILSKS